MNRTISVTVDTEEEGLWGGHFPVRNCTTENLRGLARFQNLCEKYSIPPTYLVDAPVLDDRLAVGELKSWMDQGRCEIGAHTHPWCNPPLVAEQISNRESFFCNLPEDLRFEKLKWLTHRIADVFERSPKSYRAGRYGFARSCVKHLSELGYLVDSSVLPFVDYSSEDGPDFRSSTRFPHRITEESSIRGIIELPISTGFSRPGFYQFRKRLWRLVGSPLGKRTKIAGIAVRLGVTRHLKLSPEGTTIRDLKGLIDGLVRDGLSHIVLMLHSTSLAPGFSPYCKSPEALEALYSRLDETLRYSTENYDFQGSTLVDVSRNLSETLPK